LEIINLPSRIDITIGPFDSSAGCYEMTQRFKKSMNKCNKVYAVIPALIGLVLIMLGVGLGYARDCMPHKCDADQTRLIVSGGALSFINAMLIHLRRKAGFILSPLAKHFPAPIRSIGRIDENTKGCVIFCVLVLFAAYGAYVVAPLKGIVMTRWMKVYHPSDFTSWTDIIPYLKQLRLPINPLVSAFEIGNYQLVGNVWFSEVFLYQASLVAVYIIAMMLTSKTIKSLAFGFALSAFFLFCTRIIHPVNPQVYDIYFPLFILLYIGFLNLARTRGSSYFCFYSGLSLSMAELTRPFVIFLLPFLLIGTYRVLANCPASFCDKRKTRLYYLSFLLPLVLFSGSWHFHLAVTHGQITATPHSGFNLQNSWHIQELPQLIDTRVKEPWMINKDTLAEHYENSKRMQSAIISYWAKRPLLSFGHACELLRKSPSLAATHWGLVVEHPLMPFYLLLLNMLVCLLYYNFIQTSINAFILRRGAVLDNVDYILMFITVSTVLFQVFGDSGEESRFFITILPLLAVVSVKSIIVAAPHQPWICSTR